MPLDVDPHPEGNVVPVFEAAGRPARARVLTKGELPAKVPAWRSHFVTCPKAGLFRRSTGERSSR